MVQKCVCNCLAGESPGDDVTIITPCSSLSLSSVLEMPGCPSATDTSRHDNLLTHRIGGDLAELDGLLFPKEPNQKATFRFGRLQWRINFSFGPQHLNLN
ncbi:hypothetical protein E2C01_041265 [Portunus trituberculatus]|uniref:Uncharacterized protein n=1 Tax=Portunus trituberculatus TaxID=210409 RepID=A0A5B7FPY6_PORTR|nr:hypothetical protein [Portunus trituberculatus]